MFDHVWPCLTVSDHGCGPTLATIVVCQEKCPRWRTGGFGTIPRKCFVSFNGLFTWSNLRWIFLSHGPSQHGPFPIWTFPYLDLPLSGPFHIWTFPHLDLSLSGPFPIWTFPHLDAPTLGQAFSTFTLDDSNCHLGHGALNGDAFGCNNNNGKTSVYLRW